MAKADFLKKRADEFFKDAENNIKERFFALAAFHLEQTCQLYLKYYLFKNLGDFPKVHSLDQLLMELGKVYDRKLEIDEFRKDNASVIGDLNQSYLTSRYLPVEFNKYQAANMKKFAEDLICFLQKLCQQH